MPTVHASSPAKINLTFDIKGLMPDGYHEVETLLQSIDLQDQLRFELTAANELAIRIVCHDSDSQSQFPFDESNLIAKAARLFFTETKLPPVKLEVAVTKTIPIGAGLAGGSANAAATLVSLNQFFGQPLISAQLLQLGSQLGADVPFCIQGGTSCGIGRGDQLEPVPAIVDFSFCIVKPRHLSVATPFAFRLYDEYKGPVPHPNMSKAMNCLQDGDDKAALTNFGNSFEPVIFAHMPELIALKERLLSLGALYCQLSGSGPALFAVAPDKTFAQKIKHKLGKIDNNIECHIANSINYGARVFDVQPA